MSKVSIIGAGFVGSTTAFSLLAQNVASEIALVDVNKERAQGEALDLAHGLVYSNSCTIRYSDTYTITRNSQIIIITAGAAQKPGETRLDLVTKNAAILKRILDNTHRYSPHATYIIISNPVDILTMLAKRYLKRKGTVFGSGTALDTARLRDYLSETVHVNPKSIHAYVLGEHGDSSFPAWSTANIGTVPIKTYPGLTKEQLDNAFRRTRESAYEIIAKKGATYYAIALTATHICTLILSDRKQIIPLSTVPEPYGIRDVSLSVPCVVGKNGIEHIISLPLSRRESRLLERSADTLRPYVQQGWRSLKHA